MEDLQNHIRQLRTDYSKMTLDESMVKKDPVQQFADWYHAAVESKVNEPNAMVVSTVNAEGRPSARVMLLRNFSDEGFSFYTNYKSRKGKEIGQNPFVCLTFFWPELERQVRIEGKLVKQNSAESDEYFSSRPRESRIGAWASPQSEIIPDRKSLEEDLDKMTNQFDGKEVTRPDWWGGFVLIPDRFEFWQGRASRLHDRICYVKNHDGNWHIARLAP